MRGGGTGIRAHPATYQGASLPYPAGIFHLHAALVIQRRPALLRKSPLPGRVFSDISDSVDPGLGDDLRRFSWKFLELCCALISYSLPRLMDRSIPVGGLILWPIAGLVAPQRSICFRNEPLQVAAFLAILRVVFSGHGRIQRGAFNRLAGPRTSDCKPGLGFSVPSSRWLSPFCTRTRRQGHNSIIGWMCWAECVIPAA